MNAFESVKTEYEDALKKCEYSESIEYEQPQQYEKGKRKRKRNIIYFQPPYCATVKTPIGRMFLNLVRRHFGNQHPLRKILNTKCLKISYCCLPNVKARITSSNNKILKKDKEEDSRTCNCRKKEECPVNNNCLLEKVIYKAEITEKNGDIKEYIGSTGNTFKERYNQHRASMREGRKIKTTKKDTSNDSRVEDDQVEDDQVEDEQEKERKTKGEKHGKKKKKNTGTALSRHYWKTKKKDGVEPKIKWSIVAQTRATPNERNGCTLCNLERMAIAKANAKRTLNVRTELTCMCPHFTKNYFKKPI